MRVQISQALTVAEVYNLGRYGEVLLLQAAGSTALHSSTRPARPAMRPSGRSRTAHRFARRCQHATEPRSDFLSLARLVRSQSLRVGDTVSGLTAVVDYRFSAYRLQPLAAAPELSTPTRGRCRWPARSRARGERQRAQLLQRRRPGRRLPHIARRKHAVGVQPPARQDIAMLAALDADVVGLIEVENDAGAAGALADLVAGLNAAAGGSVYAGSTRAC